MDDFEKKYFEKLRKLALGFGAQRRELAKSRIKMFSASVARQILDEKMEFDLIIGGGNSGLYMTKIAQLVYETLNTKSPQILNIPLIRIIDEGKEIQVLKNITDGLKNIDAENILFVDDEIMRSITAKTCFEFLLTANSKIKHLNATIIAENHFFEWHYRMPKVSVSFFAYSRLIQWLNSNVAYFVPEDLFDKIRKELPDIKTYTHAMAIVVGGGVKKLENKTPYFDFNIESDLSKLPNYRKEKENLLIELERLVSEGVEDYKTGKIKFRF